MIYLASPYTHKDPAVKDSRYEEVTKAAVWLANHGSGVYSPIMHWHEAAKKHAMPTDFAFWQNDNFCFIAACSTFAILTIDGWDTSVGVAGELRFAKHIGKQRAYMHKCPVEFGQYVFENIP